MAQCSTHFGQLRKYCDRLEKCNTKIYMSKEMLENGGNCTSGNVLTMFFMAVFIWGLKRFLPIKFDDAIYNTMMQYSRIRSWSHHICYEFHRFFVYKIRTAFFYCIVSSQLISCYQHNYLYALLMIRRS